MKGYVLAVTGAILLASMISMLLPEGKIGKFLKGICGLMVFSAVVAPLISLFSGRKLALNAGEVGTDEGYLAACAQLLEEQDRRDAEQFLSEQFSLSCTVLSERAASGGFALQKITVKISENGIFGQDEHIDMAERIKSALEERYRCPAEVIWDG